MKLCKDCKYYYKDTQLGIEVQKFISIFNPNKKPIIFAYVPVCVRPGSEVGVDPVDGTINYPNCKFERSDNILPHRERCGPEGKYWENGTRINFLNHEN